MTHSKSLLLTRRFFLALTGAAVGSRFIPAFAGGAGTEPNGRPPSFKLFYKPEHTGNIWDTWIYHHKDTYYLYYNPSPSGVDSALAGGYHHVALATSTDGVHWQERGIVIEETPGTSVLGAGSVWPVGDKFIMTFSESPSENNDNDVQQIYFAESQDLVHWKRLGKDSIFRQDARWYDAQGRWDNISAVPRPDGGYYGYWASTPKNKAAAIGFGETDDGVTWRAGPPAILEGVKLHPPMYMAPEVTGAYVHNGKYYILLGLDDLNPTVVFSDVWEDDDDIEEYRAGITTMVSDSAGGPFYPSPKNRRLLVSNSSAYFLRFANVGDDVLANHHSWEVDPNLPLGIHTDWVYMAPLKRAEWDDEGTLRLKWWEQNNLAKEKPLPVVLGKPATGSGITLLATSFDPDKILILEGEMSLPKSKASADIGLYLQGTGNTGVAFLVRENGAVDFGAIRSDGSGFTKEGSVDRELGLSGSVRFRLIRRGRLTEFYLNDYLMQCYSLPELGTGRIGFLGPLSKVDQLKAWYC